MRYLIALAILVLLVGCLPESQSRFVIVGSGSDAYRLDARTGQVARVTPDGVKPLLETATPLVVGGIYESEDGSRVKYVGKGKFESAVTVKNW